MTQLSPSHGQVAHASSVQDSGNASGTSSEDAVESENCPQPLTSEAATGLDGHRSLSSAIAAETERGCHLRQFESGESLRGSMSTRSISSTTSASHMEAARKWPKSAYAQTKNRCQRLLARIVAERARAAPPLPPHALLAGVRASPRDPRGRCRDSADSSRDAHGAEAREAHRGDARRSSGREVEVLNVRHGVHDGTSPNPTCRNDVPHEADGADENLHDIHGRANAPQACRNHPPHDELRFAETTLPHRPSSF
mmetsp:Transcript_21063/g.65883  ORF Transcript_21063/g.65883 Transcript_21063/m.65883 type:complete len:254 (+) Transcript_21063:289-1050(+)